MAKIKPVGHPIIVRNNVSIIIIKNIFLLFNPIAISIPISCTLSRTDINIYKVEGARLAVEMGNPLTFNMIVLGAFLKAKPVIKMENVKKGLEKSLPERHHKLIPLNLKAIEVGQANLEVVQEV